MSKTNVDNLIDINKRKGLPRSYRFNPFIRWFTLLISFLIIAYAVMFFFSLTYEHSFLQKIFPFLLLLLVFNSVYKNLFTLNSVKILEDKVIFNCLGLKKIEINLEDIKRVILTGQRSKSIKVFFESEGKPCTFYIPATFPNLIEILNSIAEMNKEIEFDDFLSKIIISKNVNEKKHNSDK